MKSLGFSVVSSPSNTDDRDNKSDDMFGGNKDMTCFIRKMDVFGVVYVNVSETSICICISIYVYIYIYSYYMYCSSFY